MKKVLNIGIGGRSFTIDDDAYRRLDDYLNQFRQKAQMGCQTKEVMDELEMRIADIFTESLTSTNEVVNLLLVSKVISQLGMPDGSTCDPSFNANKYNNTEQKPVKKYYRDSDSKVIGGVAGGLAVYLDIDVVLVRILFVVAIIFGSLGFWVYLIIWIVAPMAVTASQKCELRGLPITAENLRRYSNTK
jgi:phage shock protein PspC (stress-responsive transcriptional regulator)